MEEADSTGEVMHIEKSNAGLAKHNLAQRRLIRALLQKSRFFVMGYFTCILSISLS